MKILIIGLGSIGQRHLKNIYKLYPKTKFFAYRRKYTTPSLNNKNEPININLIKKYKIEKIPNLENLDKLKLDAAFICTPSAFHIDESITLLKKNINTFVEKPLGSSLKRLKILKQVVKKTKAIHMIGFQMRFSPIIWFLKKLLKKNSYGKLNFANIHNGENIEDFHLYENYKKSYTSKKSLGGGVLLSQIHEIDYFINLFQDYKIIKSHSIISKNSTLDIDTEDTVSSIFQLKNKSNLLTVNLNLNFYERPKKKSLILIFEKSKIEVDFNKNIIIIFTQDKIIKKNFSFNRNDLFLNEVNFFLNHIKKNKKINKDFNIMNGIKTLEFCQNLKKNLK
jgi:predicted dehydrogenase